MLFTSHNQEEVSFKWPCVYVVLDSVCSSIVWGMKWLSYYIESLDESNKDKVKLSFGQKNFMFGGGRQLKSQGVYVFQQWLQGKK